MLDLQTRVHLDEVPGRIGRELAALDQELDRPRALVADGPRAGDGRLRHLRPQPGRHARRRRLLDHLLVAPLQRAVALEEMHDVAVAVAEHLHLDVARPGDDLLQQHARIAEGRLRLALRALQRRGEVALRLHQPHAAAAAAGHRLDHHRIADALGFLGERLGALRIALVAGHHRHAGFGRDRLGLGLAAHAAHGLRARADEGDAGRAHGFGKVGVLGEKAVARMDAVGAGLLRRGDDLVDAQIALARRDRARSPPPRRPARRTARAGRARRRRPPSSPRACGRCG